MKQIINVTSSLFKAVVVLYALSLQTVEAAPVITANEQPGSTITYRITMDKSNPKVARVQMSFVPKDSLLYMTQGAGQFPDRWATFVHELKVTDGGGNPITVKDMADAMWMMPYTPKEEITVSYLVRLDHAEHEWNSGLDGAAYATDWGVFYTARALLIFNGADWKDINVDFVLPEDWKVSTPWMHVAGSKNSYKVFNYNTLMLSMIFAGTHEELSFREGDFELIFALGGEQVLAEKETYQKMATGVLQYYVNLMGGLPNPSPDMTIDKCLVIINEGNSTDGEVIGANISILIEKDGDAMSRMISRFVFAHEFFHLWNGKSFLPDDQETEWFKEGFTNYYTLKALHHIGFLDDASYFGVLNNLFYQRYRTDDGLGKLSMTRGEEKHAHWGLIYGGGLFVAIAQDISIRKASGNTKSLDDLMRKFYTRYGGTHEHYVIDDVLQTLTDLNGKDQTPFFKQYIRGAQQLPIAEYLSQAGLDARVEEGQLKISEKITTTSLQQQMIHGMLGNTY